MTPDEIRTARENFIAKCAEHYPNRFRELYCSVYKLARLKHNTGFRGVVWFKKDDLILAARRVDGSVTTFSWHPVWNPNHGELPPGHSLQKAVVGWCSLPNARALEWIET